MVDEERNELIERIRDSAEFRSAEKLRELLQSLYDAGEMRMKAHRGLCGDLREKLASDAATNVLDGDLQCLLPTGDKHGFKLEFKRKGGFAGLFWKPHVTSEKTVTIVHNEVLFFLDPTARRVFRYWDTEDQFDCNRNLEDLERDHPTDYADDLKESRIYVFGSEIKARDAIGQWFRDHRRVAVDYRSSSDLRFRELNGVSPILLGNRRTNPLIREIFTSTNSQLAYTYSEADFGVTQINDPDEKERERIRRLPPESYTLDSARAVLHDTTKAPIAFGVVTRIPQPRGRGHITIISSSYVRVIERIAKTMTVDEAFARMLGRGSPAKLQPLPKSFQALIGVELPDPGLDHPAGEAQLICWRIYVPADKP